MSGHRARAHRRRRQRPVEQRRTDSAWRPVASRLPRALVAAGIALTALGSAHRMFRPVSSSLDPKDGGLGIYKPDFMRSNIGPDYNKVDQALPFVCGGGDGIDWSNR